MKAILKHTLAVALTILCINLSVAQSKRVKGNGTITTITHTTSDYDAINVVGFMDVKLEKGTEGSITVKTDENLQEYIIVETKNGTLSLKIKKGMNLSTNKGVIITVPFSEISKVSLTGSGDVYTADMIKTDSFEVNLTGSGDMILEVKASTIDAKITGSGDLKVSGETNDLEIKITGSGDFAGKSLIAKNTQAYISGSGDASVYASNSLKARVSGSGDISYSGNPDSTDLKVIGSGDIDSN